MNYAVQELDTIELDEIGLDHGLVVSSQLVSQALGLHVGPKLANTLTVALRVLEDGKPVGEYCSKVTQFCCQGRHWRSADRLHFCCKAALESVAPKQAPPTAAHVMLCQTSQ